MTLSKGSEFWKITFGNLLTICIYLIVAGIYVGKQQTIIVNQEIAIKKNAEDIQILATKVAELDKTGSQVSRLDSTRIVGLDSRMIRLEEYIPKIAVLTSRVEDLSALLKEVRDDVKHLKN